MPPQVGRGPRARRARKPEVMAKLFARRTVLISDGLRESRKSIAIGCVEVGLCDILCGCPRGDHLRGLSRFCSPILRVQPVGGRLTRTECGRPCWRMTKCCAA